MITCREHTLCLGIPNDKREHATQVFDNLLSPVVEANNDWLTVPRGIEIVACLLQFLAKLDVVINLAVERQRVALRILLRAPA